MLVAISRYSKGVTPEELSELIHNCLAGAAKRGDIALTAEEIPAVKVERPRNREHGDWATNVAMQLAKKAQTNPRALATLLSGELETVDGISSVEVAGPGFLNIRLSAASAGQLAQTILEQGPAYGRNQSQKGAKVNLEFVSANPTGPIHIGGARWAAVGDAMARVLEAAGAQVTREYYFNDHGNQINNFSASLLAAAKGRPTPQDGYGGKYIGEVAEQVIAQVLEEGGADPRELPDEQAQEVFREKGVKAMFAEIQESLHEFRTDFDVFFHEQTLHESGAVDEAIDRLRHAGVIFESEGALWLRSTEFGDDKDRVLIKSDGNAAYFSGDVAYYLNKRNRGFDQCIYMLGADHHGYIGRMYAMARAFGDEAGPGKNMEILIGQLVNLVRGGKPVRMSKRAGTVVTLEDLVEAVGVDAARYSLIRSSVDTTLELDLDVVASNTNENPVYYVQYAHARTCAVARNAKEHGVRREDGFAPQALDSTADGELLGTLARYPEIVAQAASLREPHRVARYLEELAGAYHAWYGQCRVTPRGDSPVEASHVARLWLNDAVGQVLRNGLDLLGVQAPERM
ncbi:arginine--tRNA ligase [Winkia neuii]|nr:arginine--tRNA ligase [Winkia neuii]